MQYCEAALQVIVSLRQNDWSMAWLKTPAGKDPQRERKGSWLSYPLAAFVFVFVFVLREWLVSLVLASLHKQIASTFQDLFDV